MKSKNIDFEEYAEKYPDKQDQQGNEIVEAEDGNIDAETKIRPLSLAEALQKHEEIQRSNDRSEQTIKSHKSRLKKFCAWLRINDVEKTTEIEPIHFNNYRLQRSKNVKKVTCKTHMDSIRVFIRNLEECQAVEEGLHDYVRSPSLEGNEGQRSDFLEPERGNKILENVRKYRWGSVEHICYELWWAAGIRLGGIHSLDEKDINLDNQYVDLKHRPDKGTTLKNQYEGERKVSIVDETTEAIKDYLNNPERPNTTDDYGRKPLLSSPNGGRFSKGHLRNMCYYLTLPCVTEGVCPHDKDPESCEWQKAKNKASKCPSSKAPHALRSGTLTRQMLAGIEIHYISQRANVGTETLENHYNEMSEEEKMEVRRKMFDEEFSQAEAESRMFGKDHE